MKASSLTQAIHAKLQRTPTDSPLVARCKKVSRVALIPFSFLETGAARITQWTPLGERAAEAYKTAHLARQQVLAELKQITPYTIPEKPYCQCIVMVSGQISFLNIRKGHPEHLRLAGKLTDNTFTIDYPEKAPPDFYQHLTQRLLIPDGYKQSHTDPFLFVKADCTSIYLGHPPITELTLESGMVLECEYHGYTLHIQATDPIDIVGIPEQLEQSGYTQSPHNPLLYTKKDAYSVVLPKL